MWEYLNLPSWIFLLGNIFILAYLALTGFADHKKIQETRRQLKLRERTAPLAHSFFEPFRG